MYSYTERFEEDLLTYRPLSHCAVQRFRLDADLDRPELNLVHKTLGPAEETK